MTQFSSVQKEFLENLFTKLNDTINEKTSEIRNEIKEKIDEVKHEVKASLRELETKVNVLEVENKKLTEATLRLERRVRKNNIVIFGARENESDLIQTVCNIFTNILEVNINKEDINDTYCLGNPKNNNSPIIVEFISYQNKLSILKNTKKLKGSNISISSDLCFEDRKDKKILVKHLKEARNKGAVAYLKGGKLYVSGEPYTVRDLEREVDSEEEEQIQTTTYPNTQESSTFNRPGSAPPTPDPLTRRKRLLEEEEDKDSQYQKNKKKSKAEDSNSEKSATHAIRTRSNSQKS